VLDGIHVGAEVAYAVRPEMIAIGADAQSCANHLPCSSVQQIYRGAEIEYLVSIAGKHQFKVVKPTGGASLEEDEVVYVGWQPENAVVIGKPSIVEKVDIDRAILGA
jgi:ABC-type Fe3+/spermidine/putrescine transport system ATPase subunit